MAEIQTEEPIDVTKLGPHIGQVLTAHHERHQNDRQQVREVAERRRQERERKLVEFQEKLKPIIESPELAGAGATKAYEVQRLDTGTVVAGMISAQLEEDKEAHSVQEVAKALVSTDRGPDALPGTTGRDDPTGYNYINRGALSQLGPDYTRIRPHRTLDIRNGKSLIVGLTLETPHEEEGFEPTKDAITFVAALMDPESMFIVEELNRDNPDLLYGRIIGPEDERFGGVMRIVDRVSQGVAAEEQSTTQS